MSWEQITNQISAFFDKPVVITIMGVLAGAMTLLTIFSKTSFGKKAINRLTKLYDDGNKKATETLKKVSEIETLATTKISELETYYAEKNEELEKDCEEKIAVALSFVVFYEESLLSVMEKIPNAKVKAALEKFKVKLEEKKKNITVTIGEMYFDFTAAVERNKEELKQQYDEKISFLENQIKQLALYIEEIKGGPSDGEQREETKIDSDPTEEEIQENQ